MQLDEAERQLLEYLADQPRGIGLVCEPNLRAAVDRLIFKEPRLLGSVYDGGSGYLAAISDAGRSVVSSTRQEKS